MIFAHRDMLCLIHQNISRLQNWVVKEPHINILLMLFGFIFWYRGLALGGIAAVSQLQLIQPFMGFLLAAWLLQESISLTMLWVTLAAVLCVAGAKKFC